MGGVVFLGWAALYRTIMLGGSVNLTQWDFFYYYFPSRLVLNGMGGQLYNVHALHQMQVVSAAPYAPPRGTLLPIYPQFFIAALAPFGLMSYRVAYFVWLALNCVLLAASLYALERYARLRRKGIVVFRVAAFLSFPVLVATVQGQASLLLLALFTVFFLALRADRQVVAGIALGITLIKPQYAPEIVLALILYRKWHAIAAFAVSALVLFTAPIPLFGFNVTFKFLHVVMSSTRDGGSTGAFSPYYNHGFAAFTQLLLPKPAASWIALILGVCTVLLLVQALMRPVSLDFGLALALLVGMLVSPHELIHDLSLLIIPIAVALTHRLEGPDHLGLLIFLGYLAVPVGFVLAVPYNIIPEAHPHIQLSLLAMCALGVWLLRASSISSSARGQTAEGPSGALAAGGPA